MTPKWLRVGRKKKKNWIHGLTCLILSVTRWKYDWGPLPCYITKSTFSFFNCTFLIKAELPGLTQRQEFLVMVGRGKGVVDVFVDCNAISMKLWIACRCAKPMISPILGSILYFASVSDLSHNWLQKLLLETKLFQRATVCLHFFSVQPCQRTAPDYFDCVRNHFNWTWIRQLSSWYLLCYILYVVMPESIIVTWPCDSFNT